MPSYLPGANPVTGFLPQQYHLPADAAQGGAATMYPEFVATLKRQHYTPPTSYCTRYCCGTGADLNYVVKVLKCHHGP